MSEADRPLRVGLTGSLAAGKSTVGELFESWGAVRIDADALAREAVRPGSETLERLRERWGDEILAPDGSLDRTAMRRRVFDDDDARRELENVVHERVRELREARVRAAAEAGVRTVVEEIPLLYEAGLEGDFDVVVVVDAPAPLRTRRAREARGWSEEEFAAVERAQMPAPEKRRRADHVIENDGDLEALRREARRVWDALPAGAGGAPRGTAG